MNFIDPPGYYCHTSAVIMGMAQFSKNCSIWPNVTIRADLNEIILEEAVNIQDNCVLHTDSQCGLYIGRYSLIGHSAVLHGCTIEEFCMIGIQCLILDQAKIGRGSQVMAGCTIRGNTKIPPNSLVLPDGAGSIKILENKARPIKTIAGCLEYIALAKKAHQNVFSKFSDAELKEFDKMADGIYNKK